MSQVEKLFANHFKGWPKIYNHWLRKPTQAQEKLKPANLVVANTVTN